jgi:glycosyltransferase involved in cell wall biosynthesis
MIETALERPLHILHVHAAEEARGGDYQTLALMDHLAKLGHRQTLLAPPGSPLAAAVRSRGMDVQPLALPSIVRLSADCDLVHAHDTRAHSMAAATARVPVVAARRVASPIRRGPGFRWKYRRTARFIAVSHYVERLLLDAFIPPERIAVVYDGVELPAAEPDAAASLILAADADHSRRLLEEAARLSGTLLHFSRDPAADLPRARVFLYIVHADGSGFPVLEAMAHGVPVIASSVGGLPEVVEDGHTGILTGNDAGSVASALARVLENSQFGANGRARVAQRFTVDEMVRGTLAVYRSVLAPPPSSSS